MGGKAIVSGEPSKSRRKVGYEKGHFTMLYRTNLAVGVTEEELKHFVKRLREV